MTDNNTFNPEDMQNQQPEIEIPTFASSVLDFPWPTPFWA